MRNLALILLLIIFICTAYTQDFDSHGCYGLKSIERRYQILLQMWREGVNGNGQGGPVNKAVLNRLKKMYIFYDKDYVDAIKKSPKMLQVYEDVHRYRGLGIFLRKDYLDPTTIEVLKKYYNINIKNLKDYELWNTEVEYFYGMAQYILVWVQKRNDEEQIFFLIANATGEVVSTYKEKIKNASPMEEKECESKDGILMEFIGPDSVKITEF